MSSRAAQTARDLPLEATSARRRLRDPRICVRSLTPFGMTIGVCTDSSNLPQRAKMRLQFRRLRFDEIGFHVLDDPVAHNCR